MLNILDRVSLKEVTNLKKINVTLRRRNKFSIEELGKSKQAITDNKKTYSYNKN